MKRNLILGTIATALALAGNVWLSSCNVTDNGSSDGDADSDTGGTTIYQIRQGEVAEDSDVTIKDVIVTTPVYVKDDGSAGYVWVEEPEGGPYSGILLYMYSEVVMGVALSPGDVVTVTGTYAEYYDKSELTVSSVAAITKTGTADVPAPAVVQGANVIVGGADAESYEGVLVRVEDVAITNADLGYGEFEVTGGLPVDDYFFASGGGPSGGGVVPVAGETFTAINGILDYSWEAFMLLPRTIEDFEGYTGDVDTDTDTTPDAVTINQIQEGDVVSGTNVTLTDVIVTSPLSYDNKGFFVEEAAGGAYSGIYIYNYGWETDPASIAMGDIVTITGTFSEYEGTSEVTIEGSDSVVKTGDGTVPAAVVIDDPATLATGSADAEQYEGVLVTVSDVTVTALVDSYGQYTVTGGLLVGNLFFADWIEPAVGDVYASITGPLHDSYDAYKLEPRTEADLVQ